MSRLNEQFLSDRLNKRMSEGLYRELQPENGLVDFCSNDYLGFARSPNLRKHIKETLEKHPLHPNGSGGSRLLRGNSSYAEELESFIAAYHGAESALLFNSGYDANTGLFACVPQRGDTIICDQLVHASIIDGIRLSHAKRLVFKHNDLDSLSMRIKHASGNIFIAIESVYSMDGDEAPVCEIAAMAQNRNAYLLVDEAHATGIFGTEGRGLVSEYKLEDMVFARIHTFGKALGVQGAAVLGSDILRKYLLNYARPFIYTTALPFSSLVSIRSAYDKLSQSKDKCLQINLLINLFKQNIRSITGAVLIESRSPVQCIILPGNDRVKTAASHIRSKGYDVRPILSPTVPEGAERLRICLHSFNTIEEVNGLSKAIKDTI